MEVLKLYVIGLPYCLGLLVWHTVTFRPSEGLFSVSCFLSGQFFSSVAVFREKEVIHLYNDEWDLVQSMKQYIEDYENEDK